MAKLVRHNQNINHPKESVEMVVIGNRIAAAHNGTATCKQRSPVRSDDQLESSIEITAHTKGRPEIIAEA